MPGKIIEINGDIVIVEYPGEKREVLNTDFDLTQGEYVFVQAGIIIQKIPEQEAVESLKIWAEVL